MIIKPNLGVCYYPEHWPENLWAGDATRMRDMGISKVRIGEFAWSRIEPEPGAFDWDWLDRAVEILGSAGLEIVLGTPTATPPKWLIDAHPDILAWDEYGHPRRFGSRRHYCFSSESYLQESIRIAEEIGRRYAKNDSIFGWQTDNEYGCHDTTRSWSPNAAEAFRKWLGEKYGDIASLNDSWGTIFWSQSYNSFSEIDLPNLTVTEPNPTHRLDFFRFSSDQVIRFNRAQCKALRRHAPDKPVIHNFMGFYADFDHFELSKDLDIASWDNYPLGFLDTGPYTNDEKIEYLRQGHPDFAAFHHDLYRNCGRGRWWVMEQQPGPVNWAGHNPAPLTGMVHTWTMEAIAHGAETVSYFRWRQAPFAQEQNHSGLLRVDNEDADGAHDVRNAKTSLPLIKTDNAPKPAAVALIFCYETKWLFDIQPQGASWDYWHQVMTWYSAARTLGLNVDVASPTMDLSSYKAVLAPSLPIISERLLQKLEDREITFVFGARTGSKSHNMHVPATLTPGPLQSVLPLKVKHSESLPTEYEIAGLYGDKDIAGRNWLDHVETSLVPIASTPDGDGLLYRHENVSLFTTVPQNSFLKLYLQDVCRQQNIPAFELPPGLRLRRRGTQNFAFNYNSTPTEVPHSVRNSTGKLDFGDWVLAPGECCCWTPD